MIVSDAANLADGIAVAVPRGVTCFQYWDEMHLMYIGCYDGKVWYKSYMFCSALLSGNACVYEVIVTS